MISVVNSSRWSIDIFDEIRINIWSNDSRSEIIEKCFKWKNWFFNYEYILNRFIFPFESWKHKTEILSFNKCLYDFEASLLIEAVIKLNIESVNIKPTKPTIAAISVAMIKFSNRICWIYIRLMGINP